MAARLPPDVVKKVEAMVDRMFEDLKGRYLGPHLMDKRLVVGYMRDFSLPGIYQEALSAEGGMPDKTALDALLRTAGNYLDGSKAQAKARIVRAILAFLTANKTTPEESPKLLMNKLQAELVETWGKVTSDVQRIVATENQQARAVGALDGIVRANAAMGVEDPVVIFIPVKDDKLCVECKRLHLMEDGITPRAWYLSEVSHQYHKRGDPMPAIGGLHPHCRCQMATVAPGFGFNAKGQVSWKKVGYMVLDDQRGTMEKSEPPTYFYDYHDCESFRLEPLAKMSTPAGIATLQALRQRYENNIEAKKSRFLDATDFTPASDALINRFRNAPITINMPTHAFRGIIDAGRMMNLGETGEGLGDTDEDTRQSYEESTLGIPYDLDWTLRPLYGALHVAHGDPGGAWGGATGYGHAYFTLKPHVKDRATFTPDDSFEVDSDSVYLPGQEDLLASHWHHINRRDSRVQELANYGKFSRYLPYVEAQIHGGIDPTKDVESVHIGDRYGTTKQHELLDAVEFGKKFGLPVYVHRKDGTRGTLWHPSEKADSPLPEPPKSIVDVRPEP